MQGKVPLQTLRENVQYGFAEANTMAGKIGVKCWICLPAEGISQTNVRKERSHASHA